MSDPDAHSQVVVPDGPSGESKRPVRLISLPRELGQLCALLRTGKAFEDQLTRVVSRTAVSDAVRHMVFYFLKEVVSCTKLVDKVFLYGSVPSKLYLPDSEMDVGLCVKPNVTMKPVEVLREVAQRLEMQSCVHDVQVISARIPVLKVTVRSKDETARVRVNISANTSNALAVVFLGEMADVCFGSEHLFKRSCLLLKAWLRTEMDILNSSKFRLSSYGLLVMLLYIFNTFGDYIQSPFDAWVLFLWYYGKYFDHHKLVLTVNGPIPIEIVRRDPVKGVCPENAICEVRTPYFEPSFFEDCAKKVLSQSQPDNKSGFALLEAGDSVGLNVVDPLDLLNNVGRSVSLLNVKPVLAKLGQSYDALLALLARSLQPKFRNLPARTQLLRSCIASCFARTGQRAKRPRRDAAMKAMSRALNDAHSKSYSRAYEQLKKSRLLRSVGSSTIPELGLVIPESEGPAGNDADDQKHPQPPGGVSPSKEGKIMTGSVGLRRLQLQEDTLRDLTRVQTLYAATRLKAASASHTSESSSLSAPNVVGRTPTAPNMGSIVARSWQRRLETQGEVARSQSFTSAPAEETKKSNKPDGGKSGNVLQPALAGEANAAAEERSCRNCFGLLGRATSDSPSKELTGGEDGKGRSEDKSGVPSMESILSRREQVRKARMSSQQHDPHSRSASLDMILTHAASSLESRIAPEGHLSQKEADSYRQFVQRTKRLQGRLREQSENSRNSHSRVDEGSSGSSSTNKQQVVQRTLSESKNDQYDRDIQAYVTSMLGPQQQQQQQQQQQRQQQQQQDGKAELERFDKLLSAIENRLDRIDAAQQPNPQQYFYAPQPPVGYFVPHRQNLPPGFFNGIPRYGVGQQVLALQRRFQPQDGQFPQQQGGPFQMPGPQFHPRFPQPGPPQPIPPQPQQYQQPPSELPPPNRQ